MTKRKVGIVGCGAVVDFFYSKQLPRLPDVEVMGVSDRDAERAMWASAVFKCPSMTYDELLPKVDVVVIATPPASHHALAVQALNRGVNVLVEKPFVPTRREAEELEALAARMGRWICVGHFRRFFPPVLLMREIVQSGVLGPIQSIQMFEGGRFRWQAASNYISADPLGGVLLDTGSHTLDVALFVTGLDRRPVSHQIDRVVRDKPEPAHEIDAHFRLRDVGGEIAARLKLSRVSVLANKVRIAGENGWVECGLIPGASVRLAGRKGMTLIRPKEEIQSDPECFFRQCELVFGGDARATLGAGLFLNQVGLMEALRTYAE